MDGDAMPEKYEGAVTPYGPVITPEAELLAAILEEQRKTNALLEQFATSLAQVGDMTAGLGAMLGGAGSDSAKAPPMVRMAMGLMGARRS